MAISSIAATVFAILLGFVVLSYVRSSTQTRRVRGHLPPGPPPKWIVGNLFDFPLAKPWETYRRWAEEYGDVVHLDLPVKPIVMLGSLKAANDLLDKRSQIYSDRPQSVMLELLSFGWAFSTMPYGSLWRTCRKHFHEHFNQSIVRHQHSTTQLQESRALLKRILFTPELARQHIRSLPGSSIIKVVYGTRDASRTDTYVRLAETALDAARKASVPGAFMAELLPFLRHIPSWLPGGNARRFSEKYRPSVCEMRDKPFDEVQAAMAAGKTIPCVAYNLIRQLQDAHGTQELTAEQDTVARIVTAVAYAGAADTTTASIESFVLAMGLYPEVQRKAQVELDRVVGPSRLPDFNDLESLTYVKAVVLETLRWMPAVPLGIPHSLTTDDECNGYHLPKGTILMVNAWAMMKNPEDYPDPDDFKPERFLDAEGNINPDVRDPRTIAFGFGRRICPGSDFAISLLSICIASMLHVFEIKAGTDESSQPVVLTAEGCSEAISSPLMFPRHIVPRSAQAERLIRDVVVECED
ncbi:hypothetical protein EIP91_011909 [Steccherinum ochraceum]|uniref:Cytochrome P450 n=1 Tax=Steccherinum ochraceum TaxID=92696 RepID=A0A4V2MWW8_9APHY|nr:hypothetical protein EIP91_011909 [Steccherinum ochraceum]